MVTGADPAVARWRSARAARKQAAARLAEAEVDAGLRQGLSRSVRLTLAVVAVLAVLVAGVTVWQATARERSYSDADLIDAATSRVELLLTADADDTDRARQILAGATGDFHDQFAQSAQAYTEFVQEQGSNGRARIDGAGLVGRSGDVGVVLIAAAVAVKGAAGEGEKRRQLRLRVVVEPEDGRLKLSGVAFLP
ncbi:hypothetical protein ACFQNE_16180 [Gordonia phosphorivorans]|uniref:Mce-associated membrane protein n=1 Tax=Gordonia phosphorivorans TaxID=1056982 RepID=A0ABV6H352_9ACTN